LAEPSTKTPPASRAAKPEPPMRDLEVALAPAELPESPIKSHWYWITFVVSLVSLVVVWLYYSTRLAWWIEILYYVTGLLAFGLLLWSMVALLNHYNVLGKIGQSAERRRAKDGVVAEEAVVYRENIAVRMVKLVGRLIELLFLFLWNTFLRILYILELTIIRLIILGYDIIYYTLYLAWSLTYYALKISFAIIRWALRVAWRILKIITYIPIIKGLWRKRFRPSIMGRWNARMAERAERRATSLDQRRRLVAARGGDPDAWQKDVEARHHFPLHHPHVARKGLRARIEERQKTDYNRRDRWHAFRKGLPMPPKFHSDRKKRLLEEKTKQKEDQRRRDREASRSKRGPKSRSASLAAADANAAPEEK
jgi:hypothetical protein